MSRVEVIGNATLYLGDCMDILPMLPKVGAVITDPPYEAEAHTKGRRLLGKQDSGERTVEYGALDFDAMTEETRERSTDMARFLCRGWMLTFCQAEAVAKWRDAHESANAKYKRAMVWIKPDGAPQFTGDRPGMGYESIVASWCGEGRSRWNGGGRHGVFTHAQRDDKTPKEHMTQKPVALMRELVGLFSNVGEIVLDPFMGSGTTGVACAFLGRAFIGVEREPKYFDISCRRIEEAQRQQPLIPHEMPKAEQLEIGA
jgi:DNA modification methylase